MLTNFDYYQNTYGGSELSEDDFAKYAKKSERVIDSLIGNKILYNKINDYPSAIIEILKDAICENAEYLSESEGIAEGSLSSYSINGVSMSFSSKNKEAIKPSIYSGLVSVGLISRIM